MTGKIEAPFVFGVRVEGDTFTDRHEETERLKANFTYGVNTILISPRRMGKTSLVEHVCSLIDTTDIRIAHIDAFGCRSEHDFVNAFATAVVRATSSKWEEWMENTKTFLSRFVPKISFGQDPPQRLLPLVRIQPCEQHYRRSTATARAHRTHQGLSYRGMHRRVSADWRVCRLTNVSEEIAQCVAAAE